MNFIGLHNHTDIDSNLRLKDSIVKVKDLITEAILNAQQYCDWA